MNDTVTMDISTYNALKADAVRANMIVDHLFRTAHFRERNSDTPFEWDDIRLNEVLEIAYPKRFKNKIEEFEAEYEVKDEN